MKKKLSLKKLSLKKVSVANLGTKEAQDVKGGAVTAHGCSLNICHGTLGWCEFYTIQHYCR